CHNGRKKRLAQGGDSSFESRLGIVHSKAGQTVTVALHHAQNPTSLGQMGHCVFVCDPGKPSALTSRDGARSGHPKIKTPDAARLDVHAPCHGSSQANSDIRLAAGQTEISAVGYELDDQARVVLDQLPS